MRKEKLEILQNFIAKQRRFVISGYNNSYTNLRDFIEAFQLGSISSNDNIFIDNGEVMRRGWRRSVIDTILVCIEHHNASIEDVLNVFKEAQNKSHSLLSGRYCNDINRLILYIAEYHPYCGVLGMNYNTRSPIDINCPEVRFEDLFENDTKE